MAYWLLRGSSTRLAPGSCSPRPSPAPSDPATSSRLHLHNNAGVHALRAGDIPAARAHLEQAAEADAGDRRATPHVPINLGWVLRQEGDPDGARAISRRPCGSAAGTGTVRLGLRQPGTGVPRRRSGRLAPGSRASRHRAGPDGPNRRTVARTRSGLPPGQPRQGAYRPRRGAVRAGIRPGHGAQPRPGPRSCPRNGPPRLTQMASAAALPRLILVSRSQPSTGITGRLATTGHQQHRTAARNACYPAQS